MGRRRRVIAKTARHYHIRPRLLWGIYGAESSWGKGPNDFGIITAGRGGFKHDAHVAAGSLRHWLNAYHGNRDAAVRKYSNNEYGAGYALKLGGMHGGPPHVPHRRPRRRYQT